MTCTPAQLCPKLATDSAGNAVAVWSAQGRRTVMFSRFDAGDGLLCCSALAGREQNSTARSTGDRIARRCVATAFCVGLRSASERHERGCARRSMRSDDGAFSSWPFPTADCPHSANARSATHVISGPCGWRRICFARLNLQFYYCFNCFCHIFKLFLFVMNLAQLVYLFQTY